MKQLRGHIDASRQISAEGTTSDGSGAVLLALIGAPAAASAAFLGGLAAVRSGCDTLPALIRTGLIAAAVIIAAAALVRALRTGSELRSMADGRIERAAFLRIASIAAAAASLLVALYLAAVVLVLEPCWYR